jgi:fructan beta-fructosidase
MFIRYAAPVFLLFLVAGVARADERILADFEADTYRDWTAEGEAFAVGPAEGALPDQMSVSAFEGRRLVNSYRKGDKTTGTLTSPEFALDNDHLSFLIGGGNQPAELGVELLVDGKRVRSATGTDSESLTWVNWDVRDLQGQRATLCIFDRATGGWGHVLADHFVLADEPRERVEVGRLENYRKSAAYYREPYRPQFHFTPETNWMNDPNGLVYFDGEYHLFYQHNPHGHEWGHMSWGHAVSDDLVHWQHLPIAIHEEYGIMAFSGSAVVDEKNTSGFGVGGQPPLVAIYTGHGLGRQTQDLAYSNDRGRTWTKYAGNPVIDIDEAEFRDPKVFWHEPTSQWVMIVALSAKKRLQFYSSSDLKAWTLLSEFGPAGVLNKPNWECPDMFELPIENEPGATRWVVEANLGGGSIAGGSGGEYFIGEFDGEKFVAESKESQWFDFGRDYYADLTWSNVPREDGRRISIGWMSNTETSSTPTYPWRSAMSIPRQLSLRRVDGKLRLCQRPVRELDSLRDSLVDIKPRSLDNETLPIELAGQQLEITLEVRPGTATEFGARVLKGEREQTTVGYDAKNESLFVDRTKSGNVTFHPAFAGRHAGPLKADENGLVRMTIYVDASSVEVFGNHGESVITDLVFPSSKSNRLELYADGGTAEIVSCQVHKLKSIWHAPVK